MSNQTITVETTISAPADRVAAAITSPNGLGTWLCDDARCDKRVDGALLLSWNSGRRHEGRWTVYEPPRRLAWQWRDGFDGPVSTVAFELTEMGQATRLQVTLAEVPADQVDAARSGWAQHLSDLGTYVTSGANARWERTPMLGIVPNTVTKELADERKLPVAHGILIDSVVGDSAAERAGLQQGDVIVGIGPREVRDWPTLNAALTAHHAGDTVDVSLWREGEELVQPVTLMGRPTHAVPDSAKAFEAAVATFTDDTVTRLTSLLAGLGDREAGHKATPEDWSVKEVLAHVAYSERVNHDWLARLAADETSMDWASGAADLHQRVLAALPYEDLLARTIADFRETAALILAIVAADPAPPVWYQTAASLHFSREHIDEHLSQIEAAVEAGRQAEAVAAQITP